MYPWVITFHLLEGKDALCACVWHICVTYWSGNSLILKGGGWSLMTSLGESFLRLESGLQQPKCICVYNCVIGNSLVLRHSAQ